MFDDWDYDDDGINDVVDDDDDDDDDAFGDNDGDDDDGDQRLHSFCGRRPGGGSLVVGINHYRGRMMRLGMIILVMVHFDDFGDGGF